MSGSEEGGESRGEALDPEPWANDERLKDVFKKSTVIRDIKLIHKLADALDKTPIAPMPKSESIPILWEKSKDLKEQNFNDLINACHEHGAYRQCEEKTEEEKRQREKYERDLEEYQKKQSARVLLDSGKRPADEMSAPDEDGFSSTKERKSTSFGMNTDAPDEGTCANSNLQLHDIVAFVAYTRPFLLLWLKQLRMLCLVSLIIHIPLRILLRALIWIRMSSILPPCKIVATTHNYN
jgi:hypothetical protein